MLANENLYVLTFSTDQPDKYSETFDQVIATFAPIDRAASASFGRRLLAPLGNRFCEAVLGGALRRRLDPGGLSPPAV